MERRSLFERIFKTKQSVTHGTELQFLSGYNASFSSWNGNNYNNTTVRACIDAIARNGAKLNPKVIKAKGMSKPIVDNLNYLISKRPNPYMNAYDFRYKVISQLQANSNACIWVERDEAGNPVALYPLTYSRMVFKESGNNVFVEFNFMSGRKYQALYDDIIHLRKFFNDNDLLGTGSASLDSIISAKTTILESIINGIKTTASLRGIIKTMKSMLNPVDIVATRDKFIADFVTENTSGIASLDASMDFIPVKMEPIIASAEQMDQVNKEIYNYFGVNEKVLQSEYSTPEWNAFYESTIEPIAIQMSQEFTQKILTPTQKIKGAEVIFESKNLIYGTIEEKAKLAQFFGNYVTINEMREIINLAPMDDGDKILQSLNFVDQNIANDYQLTGSKNNE